MNSLSALTIRGRYILACHEAVKVLAPSCSDDLAKDVLEARLSRKAGTDRHVDWTADYLDSLFKFSSGMSLSQKIHHVVLLTPRYKDLVAVDHSPRTDEAPKKTLTRPRQVDPEILELSKTLPRRPGYVSFVSDAKYLEGRRNVFLRQGVVVFVRASDGTGRREFPVHCNYQALKIRGETVGWVPKWFVPAGTGLVLVRVKATEYAAMPLGEFPISVITDEEHQKLKPGMYCAPNPQFYTGFDLAVGVALSDIRGSQSAPKAVKDNFPFEVGDWVYATLNMGVEEDILIQTKAQIQRTSHEIEGCCLIKIEPGVLESADGRKFATPKGDLPYQKKLITQRAFPPIPYSSRREIGTSDMPGGYLNLDWE